MHKPVEELRPVELARLDQMTQRLSPLMESDDPDVVVKAVDALIRVMQHRARIAGLNNVKPQRHEVVVTAHQTSGVDTVAKFERFMLLTGQMTEVNSGGVAPVEEVEATSYLNDHDELEDSL